MEMVKKNSKISKTTKKTPDSDMLPTYLIGCKDYKKKNDSTSNKPFVEESKSHQGDEEEGYLIGDNYSNRRGNLTQVHGDSGNKSEQ